MPTSFYTLGFLQNIGPFEWLIILTIALLIFGRRLPEVGRSLGKGIIEFKKGLAGVQDEISDEVRKAETAPREPAYRAPITGGSDPRVAQGGAGGGVKQAETVGQENSEVR